jgi:hypothetical protein
LEKQLLCQGRCYAQPVFRPSEGRWVVVVVPVEKEVQGLRIVDPEVSACSIFWISKNQKTKRRKQN